MQSAYDPHNVCIDLPGSPRHDAGREASGATPQCVLGGSGNPSKPRPVVPDDVIGLWASVPSTMTNVGKEYS